MYQCLCISVQMCVSVCMYQCSYRCINVHVCPYMYAFVPTIIMTKHSAMGISLVSNCATRIRFIVVVMITCGPPDDLAHLQYGGWPP